MEAKVLEERHGFARLCTTWKTLKIHLVRTSKGGVQYYTVEDVCLGDCMKKVELPSQVVQMLTSTKDLSLLKGREQKIFPQAKPADYKPQAKAS
jgi:hypothetical protein